MSLRATVYFDFESPDAFRFFLLTVTAEQEGTKPELTWRIRPEGDERQEGDLTPGERALVAHELVHDPARQERFRRAIFVLVHRQGDSLDSELTYRAAAKVAGVDADILLAAIERDGRQRIEAARQHAANSGIGAVPTLVSDGPAMRVATTPAVNDGQATPRLRVIADVLDDDGLWRLEKP